MSAKFTWPLIIQIIGIIDRDLLPYLQLYGETELFNWYDTVNLWPENSPALLVYEESNIFTAESEHTFQQTIRIRCRVQVSHADRNILAQKTRAYLGALTLLFAHYDWQRHAADLVAPISIPPSLRQLGAATLGTDANITRIFVAGHTFDEFGGEEGNFTMKSTCHLVINQEEVL